jgi:hypothetical protein
MSSNLHYCSLTGGILTIVVGATGNTRNFHIHQALLTARPKFFEKAMQKGWKDAEEKLVKLPEDDPDTFAIYEQVVYTGRVPLLEVIDDGVLKGDNKSTWCQVSETCDHDYISLSALYVLAEKLQNLKARNTTVEAIIREVTHEVATVDDSPCLPSLAAITTMYSKTPHHCPGRQVFFDCFTFCAGYGTLQDTGDWETLPREFLYDLALNALSFRTKPKKFLPQEQVDRYLENEDETLEWHMDAWWFNLCLPKELLEYRSR